MQLLSDAPQVKQIILCLDNDEAGQKAGKRIKSSLKERGYEKVFPLLPYQKDWNEDLKAMTKPPPAPVEKNQMMMQAE